MLAHWSDSQKLNRFSSVQLRRSVRALSVQNDMQTLKCIVMNNFLILARTHVC